MAGITVRTSALAIKAETTEGTLERPTVGTDFVALQDDAAMTPAFESLENAELKASLGRSEPQLGAEDPTFTFSHYLRHSGTEGTTPGYGEILKTLFGQEDDAGVEHDTVGGSTTSVVNVDAAEGATYLRGQGVMVKHAANPYEIRVVDSVATDALTMSFDLNNAPPSATNLGEAITYTVLNTGHQSVSLWHYLGNSSSSGGIQAMAGARAAGATFTFPAGELINVSYDFEGIEYFYNPMKIAATDTYLDFTSDNGTFAAQITAKEYKDPKDLASALTTAMNNADPLETFSVTYSDTTGKFTVSSSTSTVLSLLWNTGVNAANTVGDQIGFSTAADDTGSTSYEGDDAIDYSSSVTPSFDSDSEPLAAKDNELFLGSASDNACVTANNVELTMTQPIRKEDDICAESGRGGSIINGREVEITVTGTLQGYDVD